MIAWCIKKAAFSEMFRDVPRCFQCINVLKSTGLLVLWKLNPCTFAPVPFQVQEVVRISGFYNNEGSPNSPNFIVLLHCGSFDGPSAWWKQSSPVHLLVCFTVGALAQNTLCQLCFIGHPSPDLFTLFFLEGYTMKLMEEWSSSSSGYLEEGPD